MGIEKDSSRKPHQPEKSLFSINYSSGNSLGQLQNRTIFPTRVDAG